MEDIICKNTYSSVFGCIWRSGVRRLPKTWTFIGSASEETSLLDFSLMSGSEREIRSVGPCGFNLWYWRLHRAVDVNIFKVLLNCRCHLYSYMLLYAGMLFGSFRSPFTWTSLITLGPVSGVRHPTGAKLPRSGGSWLGTSHFFICGFRFSASNLKQQPCCAGVVADGHSLFDSWLK